MPLQGQAKKDYQKELMRKRRSNKKGLTKQGLTEEGLTSHNNDSAKSFDGYNVTVHPGDKDALTADGAFFRDGIEYVSASYIPGSKGRTYQFLPERPRYLTLSDGQILDRANQPEAKPTGDRMLRANDSVFAPFKKRKPVPLELKDKLAKV